MSAGGAIRALSHLWNFLSKNGMKVSTSIKSHAGTWTRPRRLSTDFHIDRGSAWLTSVFLHQNSALLRWRSWRYRRRWSYHASLAAAAAAATSSGPTVEWTASLTDVVARRLATTYARSSRRVRRLASLHSHVAVLRRHFQSTVLWLSRWRYSWPWHLHRRRPKHENSRTANRVVVFRRTPLQLRQIRRHIPPAMFQTLVVALVMSRLDYACSRVYWKEHLPTCLSAYLNCTSIPVGT